MDINEYQKLCMRTCGGADNFEDYLILTGLGLSGEAGEYTDWVKKIVYHKHPFNRPMKYNLLEELGDTLWYLAVAAENLGVTLEEIMQRNIEKLKARYPDGFNPDRSIHRDSLESSKDYRVCSKEELREWLKDFNPSEEELKDALDHYNDAAQYNTHLTNLSEAVAHMVYMREHGYGESPLIKSDGDYYPSRCIK